MDRGKITTISAIALSSNRDGTLVCICCIHILPSREGDGDYIGVLFILRLLKIILCKLAMDKNAEQCYSTH